MSSRDQYLSVEQRESAALLYQSLLQVQQKIESGAKDFTAIQKQANAELSKAGFRVEYFEVRRAEDLQPATENDRELVILVAAWLGEARLIDNLTLTFSFH
jgi:pantoate--beta-alanine ligase